MLYIYYAIERARLDRVIDSLRDLAKTAQR